MSDKRTSGGAELFRAISGGALLAFLGDWGDGGVLVYGKESGWAFHPHGSRAWDVFHQMAYRNHRAEPVTAADLEREGVPPPRVEEHKDARSVAWADNFKSEVPFSDVAPSVLKRLLAAPAGPHALFLVLREDEYESALGDGYALELHAAFWDEAAARSYLAAMERQGALERRKYQQHWYRFALKAIVVWADREARRVAADLRIEEYEWYGLDAILPKLALRWEWERGFARDLPWAEVPERVGARLRAAGSWPQAVYLAVQSREARTDRHAHLLKEAFWDEDEALAYERQATDEYVRRGREEGYKDLDTLYQELMVELKAMAIREAAGGGGLEAEIVIDEHQRFTFRDVLTLLERRPAGPAAGPPPAPEVGRSPRVPRKRSRGKR